MSDEKTQLDFGTLDAVFSAFGSDATFASESQWVDILKNHALRVQARNWLQNNDAIFRNMWLSVIDQGVLDQASQDEAIVLMYSRLVRQLVKSKRG